jgi:inosine-uridine nucleoside N-ribohydrolase
MKRLRFLVAGFLLLILAISSCGPGPRPVPTQKATTNPIALPTTTPNRSTPSLAQTSLDFPALTAGQAPILYDDDGSPDGTTALLYLLSHPQAALLAANISFGEAHPKIYIQHIGRLLDRFGITSISLGYGQDKPLSGSKEFPEEVRQASNNFWGWPIANAGKTYPVHSAPELMVATINQSPLRVSVFVTGPATNLAQALKLDPGISNNIDGVYMMGGAVYIPGNIHDFYPDSENSVAEWNIYADVQAAQEVFESGIPIYLVPLDATNQVLVTRQDTTQWRQGNEIANFAADIYDSLLTNWNTEQAAIWDLMTAAIMLKPELCKFQPLHLDIVTEEGPYSGQTRISLDEEPNVSVCLEPNADRTRQELVKIFSANQVETSITTPTTSIEPTITPINLIFRDDFNGNLQPGWTWQNEIPSRWFITSDGWLEISGEDASLLSEGTQSNLLCRQAPAGDFEITVHLSANPTVNFQQATLFLYRDGDHYVALNRGYCGPCETGGGGTFMEFKYSGGFGTYSAKAQNADTYLRVVSQDHHITGYYAFEESSWQRFGSVEYSIDLPQICLGVSNVDAVGAQNADLVARFDFIEIELP